MMIGNGMVEVAPPPNIFAGTTRTTICGRGNWTFIVDTRADHTARITLDGEWKETELWHVELKAMAAACELAADVLELEAAGDVALFVDDEKA